MEDKTWTDTYWNYKRVATDCRLARTDQRWMSSGGMLIDPLTHELFFSEGIGVWKATLPKTVAPFDWISQSKGIEQLCSLVAMAPPGGKPVLGSMDRPLWYVENPDVYPSTHGPNKEHTLIVGYSIDYASSDPKFLAAIVNFTCRQEGRRILLLERWRQDLDKVSDSSELASMACQWLHCRKHAAQHRMGSLKQEAPALHEGWGQNLDKNQHPRHCG